MLAFSFLQEHKTFTLVKMPDFEIIYTLHEEYDQQ